VKVIVNACGSKVKIAGNRKKKIVLTIKPKVELNEKFENGESATELAKDYGVGIE
jgi:hypothetical protein